MISPTDTFRPVVIAPSYNNAGTLRDILRRIDALNISVLIVNDGSTDNTPGILSEWQSTRQGGWNKVITHRSNRGKAAALKTAFSAAAEANFTHAVSIDTDGQLDPEQIPAFIELAKKHPNALIVGARDETASDYPARSRIGRRLSNFLVFLESGVRVDDSQCGLRVYPLGLVTTVKSRAQYFGFETEIITRAGWAGCPVMSLPVRCRYLPIDQRVSHFKPWRDSARWVLMNLRLIARALVPLPRPHWPAQPNNNPRASFWSRIVQWVSPRELWRQIHEDQLDRNAVAIAVAVGVFIGNLPIYGLQTLASFYSARRLHLNPLAVVLGSQISTPPINVALATAAIATGHLLLHGRLPVLHDFNAAALGWKAAIGPLLIEWTIGAAIIGVVLAAVGFIVTRRLLQFISVKPAASTSHQRDLEILQV